jgi:glycosyltransferase involved in cell wall biosynthesis
VLLVIENVPFSRDHRARKQADALVRAGFRVTVVTRRDPENDRYATAGLTLRQYRPPSDGAGALGFALEYGWSLGAWIAIACRVYLREPFGAIQTGQPPDISPLLAVPFRLLSVRYVIDQRDLTPELFATRFGDTGGVLARCLRFLERSSWRLADRVLCVNASLRRAITGRGGCEPSAVEIVGNGPVLARVDRARSLAHEPADGPTVCWVGVMGPQDRLDLALEAAAGVVHRHGRRDISFVLIGDGESRADADALAERLGIGAQVTFTGWLDEEACFGHLARAAIGIDSNLQEEVSPVKAMEYLAFGLPLVAFDLPQTREVAGDAGLYVTPGDARAFADGIVGLLDDPVRRRTMGERGERRVRDHLAWERQEERYLAVYRALLGGASTEPALEPLAT